MLTPKDVENAELVRASTIYGSEYEVRRLSDGTYFAVFPEAETLVMSGSKSSAHKAAEAGMNIAEMLS